MGLIKSLASVSQDVGGFELLSRAEFVQGSGFLGTAVNGSAGDRLDVAEKRLADENLPQLAMDLGVADRVGRRGPRPLGLNGEVFRATASAVRKRTSRVGTYSSVRIYNSTSRARRSCAAGSSGATNEPVVVRGGFKQLTAVVSDLGENARPEVERFEIMRPAIEVGAEVAQRRVGLFVLGLFPSPSAEQGGVSPARLHGGDDETAADNRENHNPQTHSSARIDPPLDRLVLGFGLLRLLRGSVLRGRIGLSRGASFQISASRGQLRVRFENARNDLHVLR